MAVKRREDFTKLIPADLPGAAVQLLEVLAVFLRVKSVTLPTGDKDIDNTYRFAKEVARWVSSIRMRGCTHPLTKYTYEIVISVGEVIKALSRWVADNYMDDHREINILVDKIVEVLWHDSLYVSTSGPSAILQKLRKASHQQRVKDLSSLVDEISTRHGASTERKLEQKQQLRQLERQLEPYTIAAATYQKQNKMPCDKGLRLRYLDNIKDWINDVSSAQNILWLTGDSSCGKSALAVSITQYCQERGILGAMLFISRDMVNTTDPDKYFPTMAVQMLQHIYATNGVRHFEAIQHCIRGALGSDAALLKRRATHQARALFVDVVREASRTSPGVPFVIVIDGFDDTESKHFEETVGLFVGIFKELEHCQNAKIMICAGNRPAASEPGNIKPIYVSTSEPYEDTLDYITRQLDSIFSKYKLGPLDYPGEERLGKMAYQASHDIRKAFTLIRNVRQHLEEYSSWGLDILLDFLSSDIASAKFKFHGQESDKRSKIAASLCKVLEAPQEYRRFLGSGTRDRAQTVLDGCQELLDSSNSYTMSSREEGLITTAMYRLADRTGHYPRLLMLDTRYVDFDVSKPISSGAFGDIYKVPLSGRMLCLKMSRPNAQLIARMTKMFTKEGIIWSRLSHPNVLPFYGILLHQSTISLVSPWAENGNLRDFLNRPHSLEPNRILLCADTAAGVHYLHEKGMVHGDIKAANILVDRCGRACVADFGLSDINDSQIAHWTTQSSVASKGGTSRYQAPELHRVENEDVDASKGGSLHNSKKTDVYAWGGLSYEILTGNVPFYEYTNEFTVVLRIMEGRTPTRPPESSNAWRSYGLTLSLWRLMERCWEGEPSRRPTMSDIDSELSRLKPDDDRPVPQWLTAPRIRKTLQKHESACSLDDLGTLLSDFRVQTTE